MLLLRNEIQLFLVFYASFRTKYGRRRRLRRRRRHRRRRRRRLISRDENIPTSDENFLQLACQVRRKLRDSLFCLFYFSINVSPLFVPLGSFHLLSPSFEKKQPRFPGVLTPLFFLVFCLASPPPPPVATPQR